MRTVPFSSAFYVEDFAHSKQEKELQFWRSSMDALCAGKITWEEFFQGIPIRVHPARFVTTTEMEYTILHLAVLSNRPDLVESIVDVSPQLKWKRCNLGWTPTELTQFLPREEMRPFFQISPVTSSFHTEPNVAICDLERFAALSDLPYLSKPLFESDEIFDDILLQTKKAKAEDEISPEKIWMGIYFDKELQKGAHPKVSIRFIDEGVGFGVFAAQKITPCSFVGEYVGVIKERKKKELNGKIHVMRYTVWEMGRRKFIVDAEKMGNFTRFINHSEEPNLSLQSVYWRGIPRMIFVAIKEIPEGAQLTFDYGTFFWKECCQTPVIF